MSDVASNKTELALTSSIVSSYIGNNHVSAADLPGLIQEVHKALLSLGTSTVQAPAVEAELVPAVSIKKSVTPDYIICLEDGKRFKSMKRHLSTSYGMTPDEYRRKWKLPSDYPMVASGYSSARSALALSAGLGRKRTTDEQAPAAAQAEAEPARSTEVEIVADAKKAPARRGRKPAQAKAA